MQMPKSPSSAFPLHYPQVNVSELGLVTPGGKVVWGKYAQVRCWHMLRPSEPVGCCLAALQWEPVPLSVLTVCGALVQVTNNPENDGCVNAVLLV